jgi:glycosyltransferase involved in cell wall biosynthesis
MSASIPVPGSDDRPPTISVLLPVYNAEAYVREAVDSILNQTFEDFELLVLDDGSGDRSLVILREYEAKDRRVHVHTRENRGLVNSLNQLIAESRGRYLARMDADDICMSQRFEHQVAFLDSFSDHVVVGGWVERVNTTKQPIGPIRPPSLHEEIDQNNLKGITSIWHPTAMIRKVAVLDVGGYRKEFMHAEDLDLWLRLGEVGKLANLPEIVLQYRLHDASVSEVNVQVQREAAQRACANAWRRRGIEGRYEATKPWRPRADKNSKYDFALRYGWAAWKYGHSQTWRTYVWEALRLRPFALSSWRLLIFGLRNGRAHK